MIFLSGTFATVYLTRDGFFNPQGRSFYDSQFCRTITRRYAETVYYEYLPLERSGAETNEQIYQMKQYQVMFSQDNTNFFFTVTDPDGEVLLSNYIEQDYAAQQTYLFEDFGQSVAVNAYVKSPITARDQYWFPYRVFETVYALRFALVGATAVSAVCAIALFIFLLSAAGHRKGHSEIVLRGVDRIPLDLYAGMIVFAALAVLSIQISFWRTGVLHEAVIAVVAVVFSALLALSLCMSIAARFKQGKWWRNTVAYLLFSRLNRMAKRAAAFGVRLLSNLPLIWKAVLGFSGYLFLNSALLLLFFATIDSFGEVLFAALWVLLNLCALAAFCLIALLMLRIKNGAERIAAGDYGYQIDTKHMLWDLKRHVQTLNSIGFGMAKAVDERLKSERLKAELITNVSHDIRTPLTSIVNYIDLLQKEPLESEAAREYAAVLSRQAARLTKLTEDLFEASKASTGNLSVNAERTDVVELINQSLGEYAERFASGRLETVFRAARDAAFVWADGRLLWRVFDNLFCNICKYSQPDTRVYINAAVTSQNDVVISLKNISRYPLNITADELLERFVRGDSARSTQGSGLGLSIAKSLTELQGGALTLSVDGDLFKVTLCFPGIQ